MKENKQTFSKLPFLFSRLYNPALSPEAKRMLSQSTDPDIVSRTFDRNVKAGGTCIRVTVLVARRKVA